MNVNLTFFIQLINLGLTYWFLKRFFFTPFLQSLEVKKKNTESLINELEIQEALITKLHTEKKNDLLIFQEHFKNKYQLLPLEQPLIEQPKVIPYQKKEIIQIQQKVQNLLLTKVTHEW